MSSSWTQSRLSEHSRALNPHALDRSPGGSSSESAAGGAGGLAPLAVGTETDGSFLCPAALTGRRDQVHGWPHELGRGRPGLVEPRHGGTDPPKDYTVFTDCPAYGSASRAGATSGCSVETDTLVEAALQVAQGAGVMVDPADVVTAGAIAQSSDEIR